jgi:O-acetyl-ADP-ribose deacetylase
MTPQPGDRTSTRIGPVTLECVRGDISRQEGFDAVVNAANAELRIGGGVAGALHRAAGPGLQREAVPLGPIRPGEAVATGAHDLPNDRVIHCLGPVYGADEPADRLLADCYRNALALADGEGLDSVAFPAISTGAFGYPLRAATEVALRTVIDVAPSLSSVRRIRFVLWDEEALVTHREVLEELAPESFGEAG